MTHFSIKTTAKKFYQSESGSTAAIFGIAMPVLIGMIALTVEAGHYMQRNKMIQSAADMGAISGAMEYKLTKDHYLAKVSAKGDAFENGFVFAEGSVQVESPIATGKHAGKDGVLITITQNQERYFSKIMKNKSKVEHKVQATALLVGEGQPVCTLALSTTASSAMSITGSADIEMGACAMHSNSTSSSAFNLSGSGNLTTDCISSSGGITTGGSLTLTECDEAIRNASPVIDPYADLSLPAGWAGQSCLTPQYGGSQSINLTPGRYCGPKNISPKGVLTLTEPGTYIFDATSLFFGGKASIRGPVDDSNPGVTNGVTLIFVNGGHIDNTNGGVMDLVAPSEGDYKGILMYGDRDTSDPSQAVRLNGNQDARLEGVLYFPRQHMDFRGSANLVSDCTQIIANTIEFSGNSALTNRDCKRVGAKDILAEGGNKYVMLVD